LPSALSSSATDLVFLGVRCPSMRTCTLTQRSLALRRARASVRSVIEYTVIRIVLGTWSRSHMTSGTFTT
jgi:hypothetical protein